MEETTKAVIGLTAVIVFSIGSILFLWHQTLSAVSSEPQTHHASTTVAGSVSAVDHPVIVVGVK